jgi:hypothetical protein
VRGVPGGLPGCAIEYQGDLHCNIVHGPSGTALTTDAPKDDQGRGESFSPTDLVAAVPRNRYPGVDRNRRQGNGQCSVAKHSQVAGQRAVPQPAWVKI